MSLLDHSPTVAATHGRVVVASVPSSHVYVRHLSPEHGPGPVRLPDPDPDEPRRAAGSRWWPPVMLDPTWAATAEYDVFHLQFGFDARDPGQLADLVEALRARGKPFVYTVHDLRNPHHPTSARHDEALDILVPAADALITLTPGAAAEIRERWQRRATVLPHPHVVDLRTMAVAQDARARRRTWPFRVGLHLKSLRASMDPMTVLPTLVDTVARLPGAVLQVDGHRDVLDFADQGPVLGYLLDEDRYDAESLADAVNLAHETRPRLGASIDLRRQQRAHVARAHELLYRSLIRSTR